MATLLHIDTATPVGSVCLSKDGKKIAEKISEKQKNHASVIMPFIKDILEETATESTQIDAIVISSGPGSYTGLRVATSTAKGLCYAWEIPLIAIPTLEMMAQGIIENHPDISESTLLCPMIDARRKEVFTAIYDKEINEIEAPEAAILAPDFFRKYQQNKIVVAGTGQAKAKGVLAGNNLLYPAYECRSSHLIAAAEKAFKNKKIEDVAYFEPFYLKSVYLPVKK